MSIDRRTLLKSTAATTALGGPFAGLAAMPAEAHKAPPRPGPGPGQGPSATARSGCTCPRGSATAPSTTPSRR